MFDIYVNWCLRKNYNDLEQFGFLTKQVEVSNGEFVALLKNNVLVGYR